MELFCRPTLEVLWFLLYHSKPEGAFGAYGHFGQRGWTSCGGCSPWNTIILRLDSGCWVPATFTAACWFAFVTPSRGRGWQHLQLGWTISAPSQWTNCIKTEHQTLPCLTAAWRLALLGAVWLTFLRQEEPCNEEEALQVIQLWLHSHTSTEFQCSWLTRRDEPSHVPDVTPPISDNR